MSVGLLLKGKIERGILNRFKMPDPARDLKRIESWFVEHCTDLMPDTSVVERDGTPTLYINLHPAGQDVEFTVDNTGHCLVDANTSTAGPGLHIFLCDALHRMGKELHISWLPSSEDYFDETGYFHSGDRSAVFDHMTDWIQGVADLFFDGSLESGSTTRLAMPMNLEFESDGRAITAMGPRDMAWLKSTAANGNAGKDFFAWWEPDLNAQYFLGRALARMWSDVRWRTPINKQETRVLEYVSSSLDLAYKLDPSLDYPWPEWLEILHLLDRRDEHGIGGRSLGPVSIGYRRRDVTVELPGGWWIKVPGSFGDFFPDEDGTSCSEDPPRVVRYSGYRFTESGKAAFDHWKSQMVEFKHELLIEEEDYFAAARIDACHEEGIDYWMLKSSNIGQLSRCICTIVFTSTAERDWAIATWKSLRPPKA